MIKAAHNRFYDAIFGLYLQVHMRLAFRSIEIKDDFVDQGGSVLLIGNHFSWWDGFIARHVNNKVLHRKLHLMMDEEQLSKRRFLSKLGAFSIRKSSRGAIESLDYASEVLQDPDNLLIVFPQGRFQSLHQHPLAFEKGWFRILKNAPQHLQIVFMATLADYFASPRPGLSIYLQQPQPVNQQVLTKNLEQAKPIHIQKLSIEPNSEQNNGVLYKDSTEFAEAYNLFFADAIRRQNESAAHLH